MDEKTREALEGSIAKWQAIVDGTGGDDGTKNCPLCLLFNNEDTEYEDICVGCPVAEETEISECQETPYGTWSALSEGERPWKASTGKQKQAAQKELDFLISLRPKG